jgi:hypothetical protein
MYLGLTGRRERSIYETSDKLYMGEDILSTASNVGIAEPCKQVKREERAAAPLTRMLLEKVRVCVKNEDQVTAEWMGH